MTTSPPPAWHWLDECEVPVQAYQWMGSKTPSDALLSFHSQEVPESDALRERNDSDQCSECRSAPGQPHAPGCDVSGSPVVSCDRKDDAPGCDGVCFGRETPTKLPTGAQNEHQSHRIGTCYYDPDTGETVMPPDFFGEKELRWKTDKDGNRHDGEPICKVAEPPKCPVCLHEMESDEGVLCDYCEEPTGPGSFAVVNGPGGVFVYHLACYDEVYWGGQDAMDKGVDMNEEPAIETHEDLQGKDVDKTLDTLDSALDTVQSKPAYGEGELAALMAEGYYEMAGEWQGREPEPARSAIGAGPLFAAICDEVRVPDEWPETGNPLHAHMRATFDACLAISVAKNADYASSADPLANFRACQQFGVPLTKGIMVRLSDKFARIGNLLDRGAKVRDESITDTIMDAVNYLAILLYALEDEH